MSEQMTKEELRVRVAELLGWSEIYDYSGELVGIGPRGFGMLPDGPNDLNAMAEVERELAKDRTEEGCNRRIRYAQAIQDQFGGTLATRFDVATATAEQRCRAFVKVMEGKQ